MYFRNINEIIAPASLTKLMTSLILIENYNLSDYIEISLPSDYIYEGKVAYLKSGQKMTVESLLEFILNIDDLTGTVIEKYLNIAISETSPQIYKPR